MVIDGYGWILAASGVLANVRFGGPQERDDFERKDIGKGWSNANDWHFDAAR